MSRFISLVSFLLLIFIAFKSNAQKCDYDYKAKNPTTHLPIYRIDHELETYFTIRYHRDGESYELELALNYIGEKDGIVMPGDTLTLSLNDDNNTEIDLPALDKVSPIHKKVSGEILSYYTIRYGITEEMMTKLGEAGFKELNADIGDEDLKYEIAKKKEIKKLSESAVCMIQD